MDLNRSCDKRVCLSSCNQLLATCVSDETVRVWQVRSGYVLHEFQSSKQLTTPITSLVFIDIQSVQNGGKKSIKAGRNGALILGTLDGRLLNYNWTEGLVLKQWQAVSQDVSIVAICSISSDKIAILSSSNKISIWNPTKGEEIKEVRADGNNSMCLLGDGVVAVANQGIDVVVIDNTLANASSGQVLKRFSGHASSTSILLPLPQKGDSKMAQFFLSASQNDTFVYMWNIKIESSKGPLAPPHMTLKAKEQVATMATSLRYAAVVSISGKLRLFDISNRNDNQKPIDKIAELTIYNDDALTSMVPILRAYNMGNKDFGICYGVGVSLKFERIKYSQLMEDLKLVRVVSHKLKHKFVKEHLLDSDMWHDKVTHIIPAYMPPAKNVVSGKRSAGSDEVLESSLPMETLMMQMATEDTSYEVPLANNRKKHVHLLAQGLQSGDSKMLQRVLTKCHRNVIHTTVANLPTSAIVPLVTYLHTCLPDQWHRNKSYTLWFRELIRQHKPFISALPNCSELIRPFKQYCAARRAAQPLQLKLTARLALFKSQLEKSAASSSVATQKVYKPLIPPIIDDSSEDEEEVPHTQNGDVHLTNGHASHSCSETDSYSEESDEGIDAESYKSDENEEDEDKMECETQIDESSDDDSEVSS